MAGLSIDRGAGKTTLTLALAVAVSAVGIAQADVGSARAALGAGNYQEALADLDAVLQASPRNEEARFLKALTLARRGDTDAALTLFSALVEARPDRVAAWNNVGVLRARSGDLAGARNALLQATRIDPQRGAAQENLGDTYAALARDAYSRVGELEPDNALARAKSQQLAAFIGSGQGDGQSHDQNHEQNHEQSNEQSGSRTASASANAEGDASTPPGPNVARGAAGNADAADVAATAQPATSAQSSAPAHASTPTADTHYVSAQRPATNDSGAAVAVRRAAPVQEQAGQAETAQVAVRDALQGWAQAWTNQNMQSYMNAYSDNYRPHEGESRTAWVRACRAALEDPAWVKDDVSDVAVSLLGDDRARASFEQHYQSDSRDNQEHKRVTLVREDGGWRIVRES